MDPARWERIKEIFAEVADLPETARGPRLRSLCGGDPELLRELRSLLAGERHAPTLLEGEAADAYEELLEASPDGLEPGQEVQGYILHERIGTGGMSSVWKAVRPGDPEHELALKFLWPGADTPNVLRRFATERRLLANLDHPYIARLLDGGITPDGRPFLVMEFIEGRPVDLWCDEQSLDLEGRLRLVRAICEAVQYAHGNLIVHRDLKPDNILVTDDGTPRLLDFGISKILHPDDGPVTVTATELRALTPQYASPEQVRGEPPTTATDVYSLGVLLYELLTGRRPYDLPPGFSLETQRRIVEQDPARPSQAVLQLEEPRPDHEDEDPREARRRRAERRGGLKPEELSRRLRGDLDNIVLMALRKDPERRYGSAGRLAEDLDRYLEGLPVRAREDTLLYRCGKFLRRNKAAVVAGVLIFLSLVAGLVGMAWQAGIAREQARFARAEANSLHRTIDFLLELFGAAAEDSWATGFGRELTARELLERGARNITEDLMDQPRERSAILGALGHTFTLLGEFDRAEPMLTESLALRYPIYGEDHPEIAEARYRLGVLRREQGRLEEAEEHLQAARDMWARHWGQDHEDVAQATHALALCLEKEGRLGEARELVEGLIERERRTAEPDASRIRSLRNILGGILYQQGDFAGAEAVFQDLVTGLRPLRAEEPLFFATCLNNLGLLRHEQGRLEEAIPCYEEALEVRRARLPAGHPEVLNSLNNLAGARYSTGELGTAAALFRMALEAGRSSLPEGHPTLARIEMNLARCEAGLGRREEAEARLRRLLDEQTGRLPPTHLLLSALERDLGALLLEEGEFEEAAEWFQRALDARLQTLGDGHPGVADLRSELAAARLGLGQGEEAQVLLEKALPILEQAWGEDAPEAVQARERLEQARGLLPEEKKSPPG